MLDKLSRVILTLYQGSRELPMEEFQNQAFECVLDVIGFDSALWLTGVLHTDGNDATFHTRHLYKQPPQLLTDWARSEKNGSPFTRKVFGNPDTTFASTPATDMVPTLAAHARRYAIEQILATARIDPVAGIHELISLYRADSERSFSEEERLLQQSIVPHMSESWRLCRMQHMTRLSHPDYSIGTLTAAADRLGMLHLIDQGFTNLLCEEWPSWRGPYLPDILVERHKHGERKHIGRRADFILFDLGDHILLRAKRKTSPDVLSRREREIAGYYAAGYSHKEIARSMALSPSTVRNHLRAVYLKLNIDNKATLAVTMKEMDD